MTRFELFDTEVVRRTEYFCGKTKTKKVKLEIGVKHQDTFVVFFR